MLVSKDKKVTIRTAKDLRAYFMDYTYDTFLENFSNVEKSGVGRKPKLDDPKYVLKLRTIAFRNSSIKEIMDLYQVSQSTAYRMRRDARTLEREELSKTSYLRYRNETQEDFNQFGMMYFAKKSASYDTNIKEKEKRKTHSFCLTDSTYQRLLKKKAEMGFDGSISDFLSYVIDRLL